MSNSAVAVDNNTGQSRQHYTVSPKPWKTNQFLATFIVCIGPFAMGNVVGYTSSAIPDMRKDFVDLTDEEESLISSLMTVGALCGGLCAGFLTDYFGRKLFIILTCIPYTIGWLLIIFSTHVTVLYSGRVLHGLCVGMTCISVPLYIAEIASPEIRGNLGSFFQLFINIGVTVAFLFGKYLSWKNLASVHLVFPPLQMMAMPFMPESPFWLVKQKRLTTALAALLWLRGPKADVAKESDEIEKYQLQHTKIQMRDCMDPKVLSPVFIMLMEMSVQQWSGINAVLFNVVAIFQQAGSSIDSHDAAIIIGICEIAATVVAFFLIDKVGRRPLLIVSGALIGVSMAAMGTFYFIEDKNSILWIPLVSLMAYVIFYNLGFGPVPWLMMGEIFPRHTAGLSSSIVTAYTWAMAFAVSKTFVNLQNTIQNYGTFWLYGSAGFIGAAAVYFLVPETKGIKLTEIERQFASGQLQDSSLLAAEPVIDTS